MEMLLHAMKCYYDCEAKKGSFYHHHNSHREVEVFNYNAECSKFVFLKT